MQKNLSEDILLGPTSLKIPNKYWLMLEMVKKLFIYSEALRINGKESWEGGFWFDFKSHKAMLFSPVFSAWELALLVLVFQQPNTYYIKSILIKTILVILVIKISLFRNSFMCVSSCFANIIRCGSISIPDLFPYTLCPSLRPYRDNSSEVSQCNVFLWL